MLERCSTWEKIDTWMYLQASIFTKIPFGVIYNSLRSTQGLFSTAPKNGLMCHTSFPKVILSSFNHGIFNRFMVNRASPTKYTLIVVILVVPLAEKGRIPHMCAAGKFAAWFLHAKTGFLGSGHQILLFVAVVLEFEELEWFCHCLMSYQLWEWLKSPPTFTV